MCCFSSPIDSVSCTRIFARPAEGSRQVVVYQMNLRAAGELAMILPLPTAAGVGEDDLRFVSLEGYDTFFDDLNQAWRDYDTPYPSGALSLALGPTLTVHEVGDFVASFVPTLADFGRLDPRFKLPEAAWHAVPHVEQRGFAVFQLKALSSESETSPHPMAFEFTRANPKELFFPTLHIHDATWHPSATFDHVLFLQTGLVDDPRMDEAPLDDYIPGEDNIERFVDIDRACGLVLPKASVYRQVFEGELPNRDIVCDLS